MKRASTASEGEDIASQGNKSEVGGNLPEKNAKINSLEKNKSWSLMGKPVGGCAPEKIAKQILLKPNFHQVVFKILLQ